MRGFDRLVRICIVIAFSALLFMGLMNILARFIVFEFNTAWTEEFARYFSIYVIFIGVAVATRDKLHPYIGVVLATMKRTSWGRRIIPWVERGSLALEFIILAFIFIQGLELAIAVRHQTAPASQVSMTWPYLGIPVGIAFMIIYHSLYIARKLK
jgi:TRAP-type C4-dicarboxylate transport system permease small subunit